ncbi:hypothetical protein SEA_DANIELLEIGNACE_37 [Arthrobacter phage DanielleIgnace]|nr:hypothetical protein SEA_DANIELLEIGNACE_37 [Arthrobacter phage DanielleIgnace]
MAGGSRSFKRQNNVLRYMLKQPGQRSYAGAHDTAGHVLQDLGQYVSDQQQHEYWCAIFDLMQDGVIVEEPGEGIRLATPEELKAQLGMKEGS